MEKKKKYTLLTTLMVHMILDAPCCTIMCARFARQRNLATQLNIVN